MFRLPWVSRATYEHALYTLNDLRAEVTTRVAAAEARALAAEERSVRILAEAREAMTESFKLSRAAAAALFSTDEPSDVEERSGLSVGEADRRAAQKIREQNARQA